jgi:hypothetical protein
LRESVASVAVTGGTRLHRRAGTNWVHVGSSYDDERL